MPTPYPKDRFDNLPRKLDRVGAHRAPGKKGRRWVPLWWALAATIVLIAVGVVGLFSLNNRLNLNEAKAPTGHTTPAATAAPTAKPTPTPTAAPTAKPTVDASLGVTVLNGTPTAGIAKAVGAKLTAAGWRISTMSDATTTDVTKTTIYYGNPSLEGAARGVAKSLPGSSILLSNAYADTGAALTVVVGSDYNVSAG